MSTQYTHDDVVSALHERAIEHGKTGQAITKLLRVGVCLTHAVTIGRADEHCPDCAEHFRRKANAEGHERKISDRIKSGQCEAHAYDNSRPEDCDECRGIPDWSNVGEILFDTDFLQRNPARFDTSRAASASGASRGGWSIGEAVLGVDHELYDIPIGPGLDQVQVQDDTAAAHAVFRRVVAFRISHCRTYDIGPDMRPTIAHRAWSRQQRADVNKLAAAEERLLSDLQALQARFDHHAQDDAAAVVVQIARQFMPDRPPWPSMLVGPQVARHAPSEFLTIINGGDTAFYIEAQKLRLLAPERQSYAKLRLMFAYTLLQASRGNTDPYPRVGAG